MDMKRRYRKLPETSNEEIKFIRGEKCSEQVRKARKRWCKHIKRRMKERCPIHYGMKRSN